MRDNGSRAKITVDGTDFPINEPSPFNRKWKSHKFGHAGLRYEIGICIQTGWIVWVNGPYPAGQWMDLCISRDGVNQAMEPGELFVADKTYKDQYGYSMTPTMRAGTRLGRMMAVARTRHECINRYFKVFGAFRNRWRHHRKKHGIAFGAAANLVQARIQLEGTAFEVFYQDRLRRRLARHHERFLRRQERLMKKQLRRARRKHKHHRK